MRDVVHISQHKIHILPITNFSLKILEINVFIISPSTDVNGSRVVFWCRKEFALSIHEMVNWKDREPLEHRIPA